MNILGLSCVGNNAFIYVKKDDVLDFVVLDQVNKVSESLLKNIDKLICDNNLNLKNIDVLACCVGPGSFTGIRIGIATIKALLIANPSIKCVAFNSFEPYLKYVKDGSVYLPCTKTSLYKCEVNNNNISNITVISNNLNFSENDYFVEFVPEGLENKVLKFNVNDYVKLVNNKIDNNEFVLENELVPSYYCESQAEKNLKNEHK